MQRSGSIIVTGLALVLAVSAAAQMTPSQNSTPVGQAQTAPPQSAPQNPSRAQPGAAPSGNQSTPDSSSAQSGGNGPSIDQELQLTEDQKQKIAAIVADENRQIETVRGDNSLNLAQKQQKVLEIRQAGSPKIKALLSPEQLKKLVAIQQRMREEQQGGNRNSTPAPPQN